MIALFDATELEAIRSFEIYSFVGFAGSSAVVSYLCWKVYVCWTSSSSSSSKPTGAPAIRTWLSVSTPSPSLSLDLSPVSCFACSRVVEAMQGGW